MINQPLSSPCNQIILLDGSVCENVWGSVCMCVCMFMYICVCVCVYVCVYVYIYDCSDQQTGLILLRHPLVLYLPPRDVGKKHKCQLIYANETKLGVNYHSERDQSYQLGYLSLSHLLLLFSLSLLTLFSLPLLSSQPFSLSLPYYSVICCS